jgi:hypothetical protein
MTPPKDLAQLAAQALARRPRNASEPSAIDARTLELVAGAIRARKQARQIRWIAGVVAIAAVAAVTAGISVRRSAAIAAGATAPAAEASGLAAVPSVATSRVERVSSVDSVIGNPEMARGGVTSSFGSDARIVAGDELILPGGAEVAFTLPTGTHITVEEQGHLTVAELGQIQIFQLTAGAMRAVVHKLGVGERFLVRTSDAEVEVRGTSFRIAMAAPDEPCALGSATRVQVDEGVVTIRAASKETRVHAGEVWPSGCGLPSSPSSPSAGAAAQATSVPVSPRSLLAEQNDLYAKAITLRDGGETGKAVVLFERLVARYPSGPLAENAAVERMKLLAGARRPEAARAAAEYLAKYPTGFGRTDADGILARERTPR